MQHFLRYGFMFAFCAGLAAGCEGPASPQKKPNPASTIPSTGVPNSEPKKESSEPKKESSGPKKEGKVITTASGLKYQDQEEGNGAEAKSGDSVQVNYSGYLKDGTPFDSSLKPGRQPFTFTLGNAPVIKGWHEGIVGMKVGGRRKLIIPPDLAYKEAGHPPVIPPNAELTFDLELMKIN
jgi:FKBP-type peptidyl-prolyl cis-trans isomerase